MIAVRPSRPGAGPGQLRRALALVVGAVLLAAAPVRSQDAPPPEVAAVDTARADAYDDPLAPAEDDETAEPPSSGVPLDTARVAARPVPQAALDRLRADPAYHYDRRAGERGPSLLERLWDWFVRTYLRPAGEAAFSRPGRDAFVLLALLGLVALVLWLVGWSGGVFARGDRAAADAPGGPLLDAERIEDVDLAGLLSRARAAGRFRDATRYRYLLGLQRLAADGLLAWAPHKTDGEYLRDLRRHDRPALTAAFADAARAFAWVWYGEAPLDAARFARVEALLDRLDGARPAPARAR